jgi:RNA polymerase sigma-70 factor (ECF subfamily)
MSALATRLPSQEEALALHHRLCERDPVAWADLAQAYLPHLIDALRRCRPPVDEGLYLDAAVQAVTALQSRPESYNPRRLDLWPYLRMAARRDLLNLLDSEQRHRLRFQELCCVEIEAERRNYLVSEGGPWRELCRAEAEAALERFADSLKKAEERAAFELMRAGEKQTEVFARACGWAGLAPQEQRRRVKQIKDRIKKRLAREVGHDGPVGAHGEAGRGVA